MATDFFVRYIDKAGYKFCDLVRLKLDASGSLTKCVADLASLWSIIVYLNSSVLYLRTLISCLCVG
jgi:hypothetical protein